MRPRKQRPLNDEGFPYDPARLVKANAGWYITYQAWDHLREKLQRKKYYKIKGDTDRARENHANRVVSEINQMLQKGYGFNRSLQEQKRDLMTLEAYHMGLVAKKHSLGKTTGDNYTSYLRIYEEWLRKTGLYRLPANKLKQVHILQFFDWLFEERKVSKRTRNNYLTFLHSVGEEMIKRELLNKNPASGITPLPTASSRHVPFLAEEQARLERYLKLKDKDLYLFTRFLYYGFMRPVEICRMKVNHIDMKNRVILVRSMNSKNKKQMPVEIVDQLAEAIEELGLIEQAGHLFAFGKGLRPSTVQMRANKVSTRHRTALEATNLYNGELTLYGWKHTGNCNAYRAGADVLWLQQQNRHHSLNETEIYLRSMGLRLNSANRKLTW
ncbi:MAG: tyrosine-type recombinase/integrase [Bacteroidota bacterium]